MAVSSLLSIRTLLCTALLPAPCACAAAVRSSIAIFTTAADLNAVCVFLHNKKTLHAIFCVFMAQKRITKNMARRFSRSGDFSIVSRVFRCQGCLTRHCLVAVCQGVKVLSPDIFALQSSFVSKGQISNINTRVSYIKQWLLYWFLFSVNAEKRNQYNNHCLI